MTDHPDMTPSEREFLWATPAGGLDPLELAAVETLHVARLMELGLLKSRNGRLVVASPCEQGSDGSATRDASVDLV